MSCHRLLIGRDAQARALPFQPPPGAGVVREQAIEEGLDVILTEAGFDFRQPGCSMCLAMNADKLGAGERCASTSNRNFEGRQGAGGRTHLMSPMMAAAAAVTGTLADVRALQLPAEALRTLSADAGASRLQQKVRGAPAWAGAGCALLSPYCTQDRPAPCTATSAPHSGIGPAPRSSPRACFAPGSPLSRMVVQADRFPAQVFPPSPTNRQASSISHLPPSRPSRRCGARRTSPPARSSVSQRRVAGLWPRRQECPSSST